MILMVAAALSKGLFPASASLFDWCKTFNPSSFNPAMEAVTAELS